jgi:hypothetical protein
LVRDTLVFEETVTSKREHGHDDWDPDWIRYNFTAWAECTHPACKQKFSLSGTGSVGSFGGPEGELEYADTFDPHACNPMPEVIDIPSKCPEGVERELRASFELFLMNVDACANRIRASVEQFMDHCGIKRRAKNKHGKFYELSLHKRIEIFAEKNPDIGKQLMALKWLCNAGSHKTALSKRDLLDACEIIEHALAEIIGQRTMRIRTLAKQLERKYGKRKPITCKAL